MARQCFTNLEQFKIKIVSSTHSNASARDIINRNFEAIRDSLICISNLSLGDLVDILLPNPVENGVEYTLKWNGTQYELTELNIQPGTKYIIQPGEEIKVLEDYQYIVHDHLYLYGTLDIEGELVIL